MHLLRLTCPRSLFRSYLLSLLHPVLGAFSEDLLSLFDDDFKKKVSVSRRAAGTADRPPSVAALDFVRGDPARFTRWQ
jgi:hypothetical protein